MKGTDMTTQLITNPCIHCGERSKIEVELESYMRWQGGELIQNAFPNSTAGFRELIKTGIHDACWPEEGE
jgi:hypothetical protein